MGLYRNINSGKKKLKLRLLKWKEKKNGVFESGMGDVILIEGLIFYRRDRENERV